MVVPTTRLPLTTPQPHPTIGLPGQQQQQQQQVQSKDAKDPIHQQLRLPMPLQLLVTTITMAPPATMTIATTLTLPRLMTRTVSFRGKSCILMCKSHDNHSANSLSLAIQVTLI